MLLGFVAVMSANLIETLYIGNVGTQELAALGFTFPVVMGLQGMMMGLGMALSKSLAAHAHLWLALGLQHSNHATLGKLIRRLPFLGTLYIPPPYMLAMGSAHLMVGLGIVFPTSQAMYTAQAIAPSRRLARSRGLLVGVLLV